MKCYFSYLSFFLKFFCVLIKIGKCLFWFFVTWGVKKIESLKNFCMIWPHPDPFIIVLNVDCFFQVSTKISGIMMLESSGSLKMFLQ